MEIADALMEAPPVVGLDRIAADETTFAGAR